MELYPFDRETKTILRFVCEHPHTPLERLECLWEHSFNPKKAYDYDPEKSYGEYAKSCTDYLIECGLIYSKEEGIYLFFFPTAKGMAYMHLKRRAWLEQHIPLFASVASLIISAIALFR